jgi:hypothetical protein
MASEAGEGTVASHKVGKMAGYVMKEGFLRTRRNKDSRLSLRS